MRLVKIQSSDNEIFEVDFEIIKPSSKIRDFFDAPQTSSAAERIMHISYANSAVLRKILDWCTYYQNDPIANDDDGDSSVIMISTWDAQFLQMDYEFFSELVLAVHSLDVKGLVNITACVLYNYMSSVGG
ncbi:hypothetical protein GWI33_005189 [Rhynchophorus ferrugineus]|uniref:SKP1 component POZ domain-containing protein n=1 Tax=Rhynchophorus ferrugineus TaxID=354439 RepID=A0A834INK1_RHYFE|nr:hypothetical protein GWI33_005189 [Rhynchophorus ferrugineus]